MRYMITLLRLMLSLYFLPLQIYKACPEVPDWYQLQRDEFLQDEMSRRIGADLVLTPKEERVNRYLMRFKTEAINTSTYTNTPYQAATHFFHSKPFIDDSIIYHIIKMMPKGGALHLHYSLMVSLIGIVKRLTYLPNLYAKFDNNRNIWLFQFSNIPLKEGWKLMEDIRAAQSDVDEFDRRLAVQMSMWVDDPHTVYLTIGEAWTRFQDLFVTLNGLFPSLMQHKLYMQEGLKEFYDDNVQYMELRVRFETDANGNDYTEKYLELLQDVVKDFQIEHPDFVGIRVIFRGNRNSSEEQMKSNVEKTIKLMEKYPDFVKGFDMDNWEERTHRIRYFVNSLLEPTKYNKTLPFFFHASETAWNQGADMNLVDAVLLNTTRIGHGFGVLKHPKVMEAIMKRPIPVEVNPLSNQVLKLITDLRNHPAALLIAMGAPIAVSSDNPNIYFASPLSHDFYMAFMGLVGAKDDLRFLKQLAINSFRYSTLTKEEQTMAIILWQNRWDKFIDDVITLYNLDAE